MAVAPTGLVVASPDVRAALTKRRVARARATAKLEDVLCRIAGGSPPLDTIRELWVFGSYARGAEAVGDVDLLALIDEPRTQQQFAMDLYFARRHPYADHIRAVGCSGSSFVSVEAMPVFGISEEPASPERLALAGDAGGLRLVSEPLLFHAVTGEPLAGPFRLLWARGDRLEWSLARVHAIRATPGIGRHARTTTVPLIDDFAALLGLETSYLLAAQVRSGHISCRAHLLRPAEPPLPTRRMLQRRYSDPARGVPSVRQLAGAAALAMLAARGEDLRAVWFIDDAVTDEANEPRVFVDFNGFSLYKAAAGDYPAGTSHLHVWPHRRRGPWLAFEVGIADQLGAEELHQWLHGHELGRNTRRRRYRELLV